MHCKELVFLQAVKSHDLKKSIEQHNCKSILKAPYKIERIAQKERPKADCLIVLKLDKFHIVLFAYRNEVTILNLLQVNSLHDNDFLPVIRHSRMDTVHILNRQKDHTAPVTSDGYQF